MADHNLFGWVEIPVTDMDRAINSYRGLLGVELQRSPMDDSDMAWFTWVEGGMGASGS
jgi:predicted enzyme related to lactoylglutathione lyase